MSELSALCFSGIRLPMACRLSLAMAAMALPDTGFGVHIISTSSEPWNGLQGSGVQSTFTTAGGFHVPAPAGRIDGGSVFGSVQPHHHVDRAVRGAGSQLNSDEVRSQAACQLLQYTEKSAIEVAAVLGYGESSAFTRAFRRWHGAPPAQWRARRRKTS